MKTLLTLNRALRKLEAALLIASVLFLLLFAFLQVFLRNFFNSGINWADVFNRSMVLWISFLGATLAVNDDRHFSLEITRFLPSRFKTIANICVSVAVIVVCAMLTYYSYLFFLDQREFEAADLLFTGFPKYYFTVIFPLGFGLITFHYFVKLAQNVHALVTGTAPTPDHLPGGH
jgi:TRAP-type C4-dicarboxylate transport system permease small subunit